MLDHPKLQEFFQENTLARAGAERHEAYVNAQPFPHAVMDDFFPAEVLEQVLEGVEHPQGQHWHQFDNPQELKRANRDETTMDPRIQAFLYKLNSSAFLRFLEELTGIKHLVADPYFLGGGLHQIEKGGFLKIHADFNYHDKLKLYRRLNLLVYLNKDWAEEYGGHFELWDTEMKGCVRRVLPVFNRCVVFTTTDTSFHGNPVPLTCPDGRTRKSIALYYYTVENPNPARADVHSTIFRARPGETIVNAENGSFKDTLKLFVPPILVKAARALKGKSGQS
jgi:Rps23 Pro-64 3,4-dihydroxylase Tpa1-like proline 4-hydroxylase